jgi:hypothetical protein
MAFLTMAEGPYGFSLEPNLTGVLKGLGLNFLTSSADNFPMDAAPVSTANPLNRDALFNHSLLDKLITDNFPKSNKICSFIKGNFYSKPTSGTVFFLEHSLSK